MIRDADIINWNLHHYVIKASDLRLAPKQLGRTREKLAEWTKLLTEPRRPDLEDVVQNIAQGYVEDIDIFENDLTRLQMSNASQGDISAATRRLWYAESALRLWNSCSNSQSAFQMVNKELHLYVEKSRNLGHDRDADVRSEMVDHAVKAVGWLIRARNLQS